MTVGRRRRRRKCLHVFLKIGKVLNHLIEYLDDSQSPKRLLKDKVGIGHEFQYSVKKFGLKVSSISPARHSTN